jgi:hypothetical protein
MLDDLLGGMVLLLEVDIQHIPLTTELVREIFFDDKVLGLLFEFE